MNRHSRAMQLIAEARPPVLDDAPDRPVPSFPDVSPTPHRAPRLGRRLLLAGLVPTAVAVIAGVTVVVSDPQSPVHAPTIAPDQPQTARGILLAAADKTITNAPATGNQWVVKVEYRQLYDIGDYNVLGRYEVETWYSLRSGGSMTAVGRWLGAAPATDADKAAWRDAGSPAKWTVSPPAGTTGRSRELSAKAGPRDVSVIPPEGGVFAIGGTTLTYAQIRALPTDPAKLKAYLIDLDEKAGRDGTWTPEEVARWTPEMLFREAWTLLSRLPVTPAVRVATYRMLADVPGLTNDGTVRDAKGRAGAGISYSYKIKDGETAPVRLVETRLVIDRESGSPLASETKLTKELLLESRFTDAAPPRT